MDFSLSLLLPRLPPIEPAPARAPTSYTFCCSSLVPSYPDTTVAGLDTPINARFQSFMSYASAHDISPAPRERAFDISVASSYHITLGIMYPVPNTTNNHSNSNSSSNSSSSDDNGDDDDDKGGSAEEPEEEQEEEEGGAAGPGFHFEHTHRCFVPYGSEYLEMEVWDFAAPNEASPPGFPLCQTWHCGGWGEDQHLWQFEVRIYHRHRNRQNMLRMRQLRLWDCMLCEEAWTHVGEEFRLEDLREVMAAGTVVGEEDLRRAEEDLRGVGWDLGRAWDVVERERRGGERGRGNRARGGRRGGRRGRRG